MGLSARGKKGGKNLIYRRGQTCHSSRGGGGWGVQARVKFESGEADVASILEVFFIFCTSFRFPSLTSSWSPPPPCYMGVGGRPFASKLSSIISTAAGGGRREAGLD